MRLVLKWLVRVGVATISLMVLGLLGLALWPVEKYEHVPRGTSLQSPADLDQKVGWYTFSDGVQRLISFGETAGITLNRFHLQRELLEQAYFERSTDLVFVGGGDASSTKRLEFDVDAEGKVIQLRWNSDGEQRKAAPSDDAPYSIADIRFESGPLSLGGLLLQPAATSLGPAVVFIHGSGVSHRNTFWYLHQADYLARNGITVLLPDKRGTGKSEGTWHDASLHDYAADAVSAVRYLRGLNEDAPPVIGLVGISQGAWVAPLVAEKEPSVAFIVSVSGSLRPPRHQLAYEVTNEMCGGGAPAFAANLLPGVRGDGNPFGGRRMETSIPSMLGDHSNDQRYSSYGDRDQNVDVTASIARLRSTGLHSSPLIDVRILKGIGHAIMDEQTSWLDEGYLTLIATWILNQTPGQE